ncbi:MAG: SRPBCC family protein [Thermoanaerobaculia bacterium]
MRTTSPKTDRTRVHLEQAQHVGAEPEIIFPLLCPVREYDWIQTWECNLVYTESGVAEEGCIFQTDQPGGGGLDTWVVSHFEPPRRISFVRVNPLRTIRYDIHLEPDGDGSTTLRWRQEITALDENGDADVAAQSQEAFTAQILMVERMLEHYLKTGEALELAYKGT